MKNPTLILVVLILISSCNSETSRKRENGAEDLYERTVPTSMITWNNEFQKYLDIIPFLKLPLSFECSKGFPITDVDLTNELVKKYKPEGATVIGRLYEDSTSVAILYGYPADIFYPKISIYDKDGNSKKEVNLFEERNCIGDEGYLSRTLGLITSDFKIITKVFTYTWDANTPKAKKDSTIIETTVEIK